MSSVLAVFKADHKRIFRDPFLLFMAFSPFLFGLVIRFLLPYFNNRFKDSFDLTEYFSLIICLFSVTPALYLGAILALQLVEEKETKVLSAIAVTPFSLNQYFLIRIISYTLVSFFVIGLVQLEIGILAMDLMSIWLIALCAALQVPIMALLVASYANNQVEGMVALKGCGFLILPPLAMFFVPDFWHLLCGFIPGYWPIIAFFTAAKGGSGQFFYACIIIGIFYQIFAAYWLYRFFEKSIYR